MNSTASRRKKLPSSKVRKVQRVARCAPSSKPCAAAGRRATRPASIRREFREWRASLPTQLERDTLLMPDAIAESVVQEVERYLNARLPEGFADRLAARAHHLYPRHRHFRQTLQRPGNNGRQNLFMFMRHWTCGWLKRERSPLFKKLPWSYGQGLPLPGAVKSNVRTAGQPAVARRER